jgi:hypothetical protein
MNKTQAKARVFKRWSKSKGSENCINFVIPVVRTASKAIESALKEPKFLWIGLWIARGWAYDSDFINGKNTLTEGIFAISLTKRTTLFNSKTNKKAKGVLAKYRGKAIAFTPYSVFMIS